MATDLSIQFAQTVEEVLNFQLYQEVHRCFTGPLPVTSQARAQRFPEMKDEFFNLKLKFKCKNCTHSTSGIRERTEKWGWTSTYGQAYVKYVLNKRTCILDMEVRMYGQDCIKCGQAGTIKLYEDEKERLMTAFVDHLSRKYYNNITLQLMFRQLGFPEDAYTQIFRDARLPISFLEATNLSCYSKTKKKLSLPSSKINELFQRVQITFGYATLSPEEQMRAKDLKDLLKLVFKKRQLVKTKRPSNGGGRSGKTAKGHQRSLCHACKHGVCSASKVTSR